MGEPEQKDDPLAGLSANSSTVRRKSEPPPAEDPFADMPEPRARRARPRGRPAYGEPATVQEMPSFGSEPGVEEREDAGFTPGVSSLPSRRDDSVARLERAARMEDPEPRTGKRPAKLSPTLPLTPSQLKAAHAPAKRDEAPISGPRLAPSVEAAEVEPATSPAPTMHESVSAFGSLADSAPAEAGKVRERKAFGQDRKLPARTQQLMEAARPDEPPSKDVAPPPMVAAYARDNPRSSTRARPLLPGPAWFALGTLTGIVGTLLVVWLLS